MSDYHVHVICDLSSAVNGLFVHPRDGTKTPTLSFLFSRVAHPFASALTDYLPSGVFNLISPAAPLQPSQMVVYDAGGVEGFNAICDECVATGSFAVTHPFRFIYISNAVTHMCWLIYVISLSKM